MATRLLRLRSLLSSSLPKPKFHPLPISPLSNPNPTTPLSLSKLLNTPSNPHSLRFFSTRKIPTRPKSVTIGARARQYQNRRLWTYALSFSCVAGFIVIVLSNFQDQLVFYLTPTDAMEKYKMNPQKNKFRLGGLVLEGSVNYNSDKMEFVVTDLVTDILVLYEGSVPDLFREGHSVVVEGFVREMNEEVRKNCGANSSSSSSSVSLKARNGECYFEATEVLAKHDEKYMPKEVAAAIEKNKKLIEEEEKKNGVGAEGK